MNYFRRITIIFCSVFLILSFISSFIPKEWNYGFNHLRYFPIWIRIIFLILGLLPFIPIVNQKICAWINSLIKKSNKINKTINYTIIILGFILLFWNFRTRILYGDAWDMIGDFYTVSINMTSPLTYLVFHWLHFFTSKIGYEPLTTMAFSSVIAGAIFIISTLLVSNQLFKDTKKKIFFFLFMCTMGSIQLYFGFIEYTSFLSASLMVYVYTGLLYLRKKVNIMIPSLVLIITILFHLEAILVGPSLLYLIFQNKKKKIFYDFFKASIVFIILLSSFSLYIYFIEWDETIPLSPVDKFGRFGYGGVEERFYPIKIKPGSEAPATMFSWYHYNQIINQQLLVAPIGIFLLLSMWISRKKVFEKNKNSKSKINNFLAIIVIFYIIYSLIGIMHFSGRQDWDHIDASIPYTILGAYLFLTFTRKEDLKYLVIILIVIALIHTVPWIMANHLGLPSAPTSKIMSNIY